MNSIVVRICVYSLAVMLRNGGVAGGAATCETLYNLEHKEHSAVFKTARGAVQTRREARKLGVMNIYDSVHIGMQLERR